MSSASKPKAVRIRADESAAANAPYNPQDNPAAGIAWISLSMLLLAGLATVARYVLLEGVHPFQVVFFRNVFAVVFMLPLLAWRGTSLLRSQNYHLFGLRVMVSIVAMTSWFYALSLITVGELTAIGFLAPLFGTIAAVLVLGEQVRVRRWLALGVGFIGAMIMLRPGGDTFGLGQGLALLTAAAIGLVSIIIKKQTIHDDPDRIVFITSALLVPLSSMAALFVWQWPPLALWPYLMLLGALAVAGHMTLVRGFAAMDASLVLTFEFSRLPFAVVLAYWVFGETIDIWTWIGAIVIFGSAVYIAQREVLLKRKPDKVELNGPPL